MDKAIQVAVEKFPHGLFDGEVGDSMRAACAIGYMQAERDLGWHSVNESLPPMNEEVIVLTDDFHGKIVPDAHRICYGHIVDKNIAVDYDCWNIPRVTHWMYCPKLEEE